MTSQLNELFPSNWYFQPPKVVDPAQYKTYTDEQLIEVLKGCPDFAKFVFPVSFHKKFPDLPKAECANPKEFMAESAWTQKAYNSYVDGGKVLTIPADPSKTVVILPAPEIPITITQTPTVLESTD